MNNESDDGILTVMNINKMIQKISAVMLSAAMLAGCSTGSSSDSHQATNDTSSSSSTASASADSSDKVTITNSVNFTSYQVSMSDYKFLRGSAADFEMITIEESLKMFSEGGSGILYYGYDTCEWCNRAVPELNEVARDMGVTVWYVDASIQPSDEVYNELLSYVGDDLKTDDEGNKSFYVPYVLGVKKGQIVGSHISLVDGFDPKDDDDQMSGAQQKELRDIYKDIIEKTAD